MFINDLNYLEDVAVNVTGGLGKTVSLNTGVNQTFNVDIDITKSVSVTSSISSRPTISGNVALTVFDASAIGTNSFTQSDVTATAIAGTLSESSGTLMAAASRC
jgi:hypothetical protein